MSEKNKYGQYFTIQVIAEFMVSLITKDKTATILEPSCGKGVFLDELLKAGFMNLSAYEIDKTLKTNHSFIKYESFISSPITEKFNVVIGNPPYIRWKNIEPELKEELQDNVLWNKYFNSLCDYLFIFILKSIELLEENGELIFICTEYWLNTTHSLSLRNYMCKNGVFEEIYHFKEAPLFEKVNASFIIFKYRKTTNRQKKPITLYFYNKKGVPIKDELYKLSCFNKMEIPSFEVNSRWLLATKDVQEDLKNFEESCISGNDLLSTALDRIGDFCDIGNGMVSGLDAAFKVPNVDKLTECEKEASIKVLKAKDLEAYNYASSSTYLFVNEKLSEQEFADKYPNFFKQLKPYVQKLDARYSYGRYIPFWEFVFPRNQKLFERAESKIFVPCKERISKKHYFRFCLAPTGFYPLQDVTGILKKDTCKESIEYILAYLNNERVYNWLYYNGIMKGAIVEFSEAPIASIPYRKINWSNSQEVEIHNKITEETSNFIKDKCVSHIININNLFNSLFHE